MFEETAVVKVVGSFDIVQVQETGTRLLEALNSHGQVVLDLSAVVGIDLAGLQLVCAAHRTALECGVSLSLSRPIPHLLANCARTAGFFHHVVCHGGGDTPCLWNEAAAESVGGKDNA